MNFFSKKFKLIFLISIFLFSSQFIFKEKAYSAYSIELLLLGSNLPFNSAITIEQDGQPDLDFTAKWESDPFHGAHYYAYRLGYWVEDHAWELEFIHQKLKMENPPSEVQKFEISHGFNVLSIVHAWKKKYFIIRAGAGLTIAHTESIVRGKEDLNKKGGPLGNGYQTIAGINLQTSINHRWFPFNQETFFISPEVKFNFATAVVPIADGEADFVNFSFHILLGFGVQLD